METPPASSQVSARIGVARLLVEGHVLALPLAVAAQLEFEIGLDILLAVLQGGQVEGPKVEAREQVLAETALPHAAGQILIGPRQKLEVIVPLLRKLWQSFRPASAYGARG